MRHFLTLRDFNKEEILDILDLAISIKKDFLQNHSVFLMQNKILAMIFEKNSTRTRVSFEAGIYQLGGMGMFLSSKDIQLGRGEPIKDTARAIGSMVDMIMLRTYAQERLEEFAHYSPVPVINGLSDLFHPAQLLTDYLTMIECGIYVPERVYDIPHIGLPKVAYVGDGNNMANSWLMLASKIGFELRIACPKNYMPDAKILSQAFEFAKESGAHIVLTHSPQEAVVGANVVTTDTWASMGQEDEKEIRQKIFKEYCVNEVLMSLADKNAIFLHCFPAYRGQEVSESILEGKQSRVFKEAQNRLHTQKGIMVWLHKNRA
ncbi:ornithine carbamoyltransferase [Helicobacter sp. 12S02232-10]|uniref:ornithine carbamoyltransferase n=1 Tax=Helicobacter sp. 12S02232-10 TaxID=1476197 RepID=UPI000BA54233|nr:ornithine carbamoyltransferase [Helicobacter sp. 12S02232-10]PAF47458.1 ornithine carbamoyltransferase [Helicobacter sp. 12S02232-10]